LCDQYCFVPLAVETLGALGEEAATFFRDIGRRIAVAAGEPTAALADGNVAAVSHAQYVLTLTAAAACT